MQQQLALPAYEQVLKAAHTFNLLDARGAISVTERAAYIGRIRNLARASPQSYLDSRARLGFPMAPRAWADEMLAALAEEGGVMSTTQNLLVELLVEELPPKALRRLGEAFAASLLEGLKARGLAGEHAAVTAFRDAAPARRAREWRARGGRRPGGHAQADAGGGGARRRRQAHAGAAEGAGQARARSAGRSLARCERRPGRLYEDADGKARALFLDSWPARRSPTGCKAHSTRRSRSCRFPR